MAGPIALDFRSTGNGLLSDLPDLSTQAADKTQIERKSSVSAAWSKSSVFAGDNVSRRFSVPPQAKVEASLDKAKDAMNKIAPEHSLAGFEKLHMDSMMLATTLLSTKVMGDTADAKAKALSIMTDKQEAVRNQNVKDYREQLDKALEQQQKAKKAGIFGVIFDWIVAAVEVVTGVAKIIGGALSGNASMVAGGAMDLMAGAAGVVKAMANTMALIDSANADKYKKIADIAGKIQLTFEIAGAAIDVTSAARNMLLTKVIPKAATAVMKEGAEQALTAAIKEGSKSAAKGIAQSVGKEVAGQVSEQLLQNLGKAALEASKKAGKEVAEKAARQLGANRMLEAFSREAVEKMVSKAVQKVADNAIDKGIEMTTKELTKAVTKSIQKEVIAATMKASVNVAANVTRAAVESASKVTSAALAIERAKLQKEIDQLILDQQWLQAIFDTYEDAKKEVNKKVSDLLKNQAAAMQDGAQIMQQTGSLHAQMAGSMV